MASRKYTHRKAGLRKMKALIEKIMSEQNTGVGLTPLLKKYVWDKNIDPDKLVNRERSIKAYYQEIFRQSKGNVNIAYHKTDEWASRIFI
jgi:hypothetical protein